jgi:hypothetical protein
MRHKPVLRVRQPDPTGRSGCGTHIAGCDSSLSSAIGSGGSSKRFAGEGSFEDQITTKSLALSVGLLVSVANWIAPPVPLPLAS